ncbi:methylated-DNA--[protein]-cysteine S-methyltransferase [Edaphobacter albus]|uniref:methylated-DNA--[protein]-cysteine S-methyltransferase n=1 Tax=Edaphobacter sp. 4G125 TaxID=2763071 RepID=UPI0016478A93|nr:methylated-DNA--[protein]-cysteine S-methyltransferase [Edaphobacter sp. 4G125]QNI36762.1 methylated-DNA--[protein]-cysteine S-methyltransferase [Edaphobacter sp. 4G125]
MSQIMHLSLDRLATPIGEMLLVADEEGSLRAIDWSDYEARMHRLLRLHYGQDGFRLEPVRNPHGLSETMARYFAGELSVIDTLPVKTAGTSFQREVWRALRAIECGKTISYAELAKRIGRSNTVRAVGTANGANPIGVVVPCHRVIGANGSLTGYGGGMERKAWLLRHEGCAQVSETLSLFTSPVLS